MNEAIECNYCGKWNSVTEEMKLVGWVCCRGCKKLVNVRPVGKQV